jgi:hypothetical protein
MGIVTKSHTFVDGSVPDGLITAARLNDNWDTLYTLVNGNLDGANVDSSAIMIPGGDYTITGTFTFSTAPSLPDDSIGDAALSDNVSLLDGAQTYSAKKTFSGGTNHSKEQAESFNIEEVAGLPAYVAADKGRLLYNTDDNKAYIGGGSDWEQINYIGGYTGGAIRSYSGTLDVDSGSSSQLWFKTEGGGPTVNIALRGLIFPSRYYTELGYHNHTFTGGGHTHSVTDGGHTHSVVIGTHGHGSTQYAVDAHTHSVSGNVDNTDLSHTHDVSGTTGNQSADHTHSVSGNTAVETVREDLSGSLENHSHSISLTSGTQSASHTHTFSDTSSNWSIANLHKHSVSLTSGSSSNSSAVSAANLGTKTSASSTTGVSVSSGTATGTISNAGVNGGTISSSVKQHLDSCVIKVDGTDVTSDVLTATGWDEVGDGTDTHNFVTTGTGEMDASSWVAYSAGYHILEVSEPTSGYGGRVMIHIETT